jgi:hypothetical protein
MPGWHTNLLEPSIEPLSSEIEKEKNEGKEASKEGACQRLVSEVGIESANQDLPLERPVSPEQDFRKFKATYPRRDADWGKAERRYRAILKSGVTHATLMAGLQRLIRDSAGRQREYITRADNWLYQWDWKAAEAALAADQAAAQRLQNKFYAKEDSPQRAAWDDHRRRECGKTYPRDMNGGWLFDSEWPPGHASRMPLIMVNDNIVFRPSIKSRMGA